MTVVGKILVFFNMVFAIVISAMMVLVYTTRTNWKTEYDILKRDAIAQKAENEAALAVNAEALATRDQSIRTLKSQVETEQNKLAVLVQEKQAIDDQLAQANTAVINQQDKDKVLREEMDKLRNERDQMKAQVDSLRGDVVRYTQEADAQRQRANTNQLAYESSQERNEKLQERVEILARENSDLRFRVGTVGGAMAGRTADSVLTPDRPEVPGSLSAEVVSVDAQRNLLTISVGRDSGVQPGAELDVFRLNLTDTKASQYLGKLRISGSESKQAVGVFSPAQPGLTPRRGDTVGRLGGL